MKALTFGLNGTTKKLASHPSHCTKLGVNFLGLAS